MLPPKITNRNPSQSWHPGPAVGYPPLSQSSETRVIEQVGEYDHEIAVREDLAEGSLPAGAARALDSLPGSSPVALIERQLRRKGLRLPVERQLLWMVPELVVQAFGSSEAAVEPGFEGLRMKLEPGVTAAGSALSEVDFNKLKGIFWPDQDGNDHPGDSH